ncbi:hypothetical protein MIZ03_2159 [Rhodoferax lithotrophicus]|uniref:Uncharacterized protein n=1 Tax=Rhodoferax lithotrophicus TaxID=2798804 RepID=A0ABN6D8W1_9BURK|nr:hypothetical protein MIZ03_2159 [Rhodoferax sp. MIZ03]
MNGVFFKSANMTACLDITTRTVNVKAIKFLQFFSVTFDCFSLWVTASNDLQCEK